MFTFKRKFLKISVGLQIALSAEASLAEGQCLEELLNMIKLRTFRAEIRMPTVSWRVRRCRTPVCSLYFTFRMFSDLGHKIGQIDACIECTWYNLKSGASLYSGFKPGAAISIRNTGAHF
jgi:hypothetical protein